ncbi:hypothetical protein COCNU_02G014320 [Cocos nucifera]|uniref:Uncharacterized protein n=1 Tax=Cocos nucifera TaxID=13894 RepID=A0A8K0I0A2_COCNU|nr:hypothetical protein COCNU_02G014320 [Cocos nucifera]
MEPSRLSPSAPSSFPSSSHSKTRTQPPAIVCPCNHHRNQASDYQITTIAYHCCRCLHSTTIGSDPRIRRKKGPYAILLRSAHHHRIWARHHRIDAPRLDPKLPPRHHTPPPSDLSSNVVDLCTTAPRDPPEHPIDG